jgi:ppGpp synthetase/RelA/SpoT-type nucleotidyltranferase
MALSRSAIDRAGENIRRSARVGEAPAPEDIAVVEAFRAQYRTIVADVHQRLKRIESFCRAQPQLSSLVERLVAQSGHGESAFLSVSSRPKTVGSIVTKLARESTRLSQMQDLAGGRIVLPTPALQDAIVEALQASPEDFPLIRVTDTREEGDRHGYRAVHLVFSIEGLPAEAQIRTPVQQLWAQVVESIDQEFGTDLKHGAGPEAVQKWLKELSSALRGAEMGRGGELPSPPTFDDELWQ